MIRHQKYSNPYLNISVKFWVIYILLSGVIALTSTNIILTFLSFLVLPIVIKLVWRKNEPPIFVLIVTFHWLQINTKVFHADIIGESVQNIAFSLSTDTAIYMSLIGLLALSIGINIITRNINFIAKDKLILRGSELSLKKLFIIYILFEIVSILVPAIGSIIPALASIFHNVAGLKAIFIFLIFLISFIQKKHAFLIIILVIETIQGFSGFFSSYKAVYFLLILAYFTINTKISLKQIVKVLPLFVFLFSLTILWTAIKMDYRQIVSQGDSTQNVSVSVEKQYDTYVNLLSALDKNKIIFSLETLAYRLAYVDIFGQTIDYVPKNRSYEYGMLWLGSIQNIFMPRILFPDKAALHDSERTNKYTGWGYTGADKGNSVSMGYFAESYVDFGLYMMWFPIFLLGSLYGLIYKYFIRKEKYILLAYAFSVFVLYNHYLLETRNDKLIGGLITSLLIIIIFKKPLRAIYLYTRKLGVIK